MEKWFVAAKKADFDKWATEFHITPILARILRNRDLTEEKEIRRFLYGTLEDCHSPRLLKDMDKAVEQIGKAIANQSHIRIIGDYDVDGTTAVALVYSFLRRYSTNVDFYIPDRYEDGYGLSYRGIDWAKEHGFSLIITLDCGIKANEKVDYAASLGLDVIICDHHLPESTIPAAVAVLDPKREDDNYPFDDLSGCGVGFKLVQAYSREYDIPFETLIPLLDLLVVSISADLVSMTGENRVLAHFGLRQLNENPRKGLQAIATLSKLEPGHLSIDDIVFKIGPRINAAGRMESGRLAVELLTSSDEHSAAVVGEKINDNNNERKSIDREITQEALEMVQSGAAL